VSDKIGIHLRSVSHPYRDPNTGLYLLEAMYHNMVPKDIEANALQILDGFNVARRSGQDGAYLHIVHKRPRSTAGKGLLVDMAMVVGTQWNGVQTHVEATLPRTQQTVLLIKGIQ
jgi:hypothetical protein